MVSQRNKWKTRRGRETRKEEDKGREEDKEREERKKRQGRKRKRKENKKKVTDKPIEHLTNQANQSVKKNDLNDLKSLILSKSGTHLFLKNIGFYLHFVPNED